MADSESWFLRELETRGVSRREFVGFCSAMAAALALPRSAAARIAAAIEKTPKPILVWLEFQDCAGNTESFLRASRPTAAEIVLDTLSVDYHETIMAAAGHQAEELLARTVKEKAGAYLAVVEGSIPTGANGAYCTIGGRSALQIAREVCGQAAATIAMGTCATFGGLPAAAPNPTGALGVADAVPGVKNLINLSACPANVENLTALIVYFLTFKRWPPLDAYRRPLFAYGKSIHDNCERRAHFDAGQYVEDWGDEGHRTGLLPLQDGLQGPRHLPELSERALERRDELADRLRPPLHRVRGAGLLGQDDALLPAPRGRPWFRRRLERRSRGPLGHRGRGGGLRHPRLHLPGQALLARRASSGRPREGGRSPTPRR